MNIQDKDALRRSRVYLVKNLTRLSELIDFLESELIISQEQRYTILSKVTPADSVRQFLDELVRCGPHAFSKFEAALNATNQENIINDLNSKRTQSNPETIVPPSSPRVSENFDETLMQPDIRETVHFPPYTVQSIPRGYILIVNVEKYDERTDYSTRLGSSQDVEKLCAVFREFRYHVTVLSNPNGKDLLRIVREFATKSDHSNVDAGGLVVLAHGVENHIVACDGELVNIGTIVSNFTNKNCPLLMGKPKLLIIQACRGEARDRGFGARSFGHLPEEISCVDHSLNPDSWLSLPYMSDCVIAYSTLPGFVSWRSESEGSWYISKLVEVFRLYGRKCHVLDLLTEVNRRLVNESQNRTIQQISQPVTNLRKPFFLSTSKDGV